MGTMNPSRQSCVVALFNNAWTRENAQGYTAMSKRHSAADWDRNRLFETLVQACQSVVT
jgi:hypothetical protein